MIPWFFPTLNVTNKNDLKIARSHIFVIFFFNLKCNIYIYGKLIAHTNSSSCWWYTTQEMISFSKFFWLRWAFLFFSCSSLLTSDLKYPHAAIMKKDPVVSIPTLLKDVLHIIIDCTANTISYQGVSTSIKNVKRSFLGTVTFDFGAWSDNWLAIK